MNVPAPIKGKKKKEFIDFAKLSHAELQNLRKKWEGAARIFEHKLELAKNDSTVTKEKLQNLWNVGGALWRRVWILEKWQLRNKVKAK